MVEASSLSGTWGSYPSRRKPNVSPTTRPPTGEVPAPSPPEQPQPSPPDQPGPSPPDAPQPDPKGPETPDDPIRPEPVVPPVDAGPLRVLIELTLRLVRVHAAVRLATALASEAAAARGLLVRWPRLVLQLPVVALLLGDVLDGGPRGPVRALLVAVLPVGVV